MQGEIHADGELWSAALWQCQSSIGRETFDRILLASHFYVPRDGGFRDGVEALFEADRALNHRVNSERICQLMVQRGFIDQSECPGAQAVYLSHQIDDAEPQGNHNQVMDPGERLVMPVSLQNTGTRTLTDVQVRLRSQQPNLAEVVAPGTASYADMDLGEPGQSLPPHHVLNIYPEAPCGTQLGFVLDVDAREWSGSAEFSTFVGTPVSSGPEWVSYSGPPLTIPDNDPTGIESVLEVSSPHPVGWVRCTVDITHSWIGDLVVSLKSPTGKTVVLHNRTGGSSGNLITSYPDLTLPDGPGSMDDMHLDLAQGAWKLSVSDHQLRDQGVLRGWSLEVGTLEFECQDVPACSSSSEVRGLKLTKFFSADRVRMVWTRSQDPCHARYRVYTSTRMGLRPTNPPGQWPADPPFEDRSAEDLDGSPTDPSFLWQPGAGLEYFLVVDEGNDGGQGPVGHFGR
jgi:subtilisin-like proprotein convertase family protein